MNNFKWIFFGLALTTLSFSGCIIDIDDDDGFFGNCVDGSGPIVTEELFLSDFDGIELSLPGQVILRQGPVQEVIVEGKANIIAELELDVRNGIWTIETDRCVEDIDQLTFFITLPHYRFLSIKGSGDIISDEFLQVEDLTLRISGSGDMDLGLHADDIDAKVSGSGNFRLEGTADDLELEINGSGDLHAFNLETDTAFIRISGSGDAEVNVFTHLTVRISGSGDVEYIGDPSLDIQITGSGEVKDVG